MGKIFYSTHCNLYYFWYPLDIGFGIPCMYPEWKMRIITMYEERMKDGVYAQTYFEPRNDN